MTLTTDVHGVTVDIDYTYYAAVRGARGSCGEPLEPDEPAVIIIEEIRTKYGEDLTELLEDHRRIWPMLQEQCMEDYAGRGENVN